jgi:hypothetical protein
MSKPSANRQAETPSLTRKIPMREITPDYIADHIRRVLKDGGSAPHSEEVQHFFKEEVQSRGWYTAELRKFAVRFRRSIARERGMNFLVQVADELFSGQILEEKVMAVFLLEKQTKNLGDNEFQLFASWLDRVSSWADHDALVHDLLAPMVAADPARCRQVFLWSGGSLQKSCDCRIDCCMTKTTWCRRDWAGYCARRPRPIRSAPCPTW